MTETKLDLWALGIDLGKVRDHTAMVGARFRSTVEHRRVPYPPIERSGFDVQLVDRLALGTTYEAVINRVLKVSEHLTRTAPVYLVVDATGVGAPVVESIEKRLSKERIPYSLSSNGWQMGNNGIFLRPCVITGGERVTYDGAAQLTKVPKKDLVARLALELEEGAIRFAAELPQLAELFRELAAFKSVFRSAAHSALEAAGGEHDDLVLALALAVWWIRDRHRHYGDKNFSLGVQGG